MLCCAGFGQVCFCLSDVAHGVYYRASRGVPPFSRTMVDCCFNIDLQSTENWKSSSYALPPRDLTVSIAIYCCVNCWGAVQCEDMLHFTTQKMMKIVGCWSKTNAIPSPSDRNHSPILVDCCVMCFHLLLASGVQVLPSEPPKMDTSKYPKKQR